MFAFIERLLKPRDIYPGKARRLALPDGPPPPVTPMPPPRHVHDDSGCGDFK